MDLRIWLFGSLRGGQSIPRSKQAKAGWTGAAAPVQRAERALDGHRAR